MNEFAVNFYNNKLDEGEGIAMEPQDQNSNCM